MPKQVSVKEEIISRRLQNQQISHTKFKTPKEIVKWLTAIQAQDYFGAIWSVGLRLSGVTDADVEKAIENGEIIRTWLLRGTIHFAASEDVRWILSLFSHRLINRLSATRNFLTNTLKKLA